MNIIVTGGSGFIGSHVVDHLVAAGHCVSVLDVVAPHRRDLRHLEIDILDLEGLVRAFRGVDAVFHLAAVADVNIAAADPERAIDLIVMGTTRVWEAARRAGVARAILASTVWVYGASPDAEILTEKSPFLPSQVQHVYTAAKLASEMVVHSYHELFGQEFAILRYGIPFGPRMRPSLVISKFVSAARAGRAITLQGDGSQYRNYVYVGDLAHAHVLALQPAAANGTFNLEGAEAVTLRRILEHLPPLLGRPLEVEYMPARTGDYGGRPVSADSARDVLGWTPQTSFEEGLRSYVAWHLANIDDTPAAPVAPPERRRRQIPDLVGIARALASLAAAVAVGFPIGMAESPRWSVTWPLWSGLVVVLAVLGWHRATRYIAGPARASLGAGFVLVAMWLQPEWAPSAVRPGLAIVAGVGVGLFADAPSIAAVAALVGGFVAGASWAGQDVTVELVVVVVAAMAWLVATMPTRHVSRRNGRLAMSITAVVCGLAVLWIGVDSMGAAWFTPFDTRVHGTGDDVALTFDGGPNDTATIAIAHTLDAYHARGTFFLLGEAARARPEIARFLVADGHLVSNNSYSDHALSWLTSGTTGLDRAQQVLADELGACPALFRPPHGRKTPWMSWHAHERGMTMVLGDVTPKDEAPTTAEALAADVLARAHGGSIIVLHDGRDGDPSADRTVVVQALPLILQGLALRHLSPVRLDELLGVHPNLARCAFTSQEQTT